MEGTNTGHEDGEAMASVGVRLTAELGHGACAKRPCPSWVMALPLPERWRAPMGGRLCTTRALSLDAIFTLIKLFHLNEKSPFHMKSGNGSWPLNVTYRKNMDAVWLRRCASVADVVFWADPL